MITLCDDANEGCPVFVGKTQRIHWSFPDPAANEGSETERLAAFRRKADSMGLYLEVGMPSPNPFRIARELSRPVSATV